MDSLVPVLVFESDNRRIVEVNSAAAALFKATSETLQGQYVDVCVVAEERARLRASIGILEPRWGDVGPWLCVASDGSRFTAQIRFHQTVHRGLLVHFVLATNIVQLQSARAANAGQGDSLSRCG